MQGEETRELVREKVLANLAESVPSAVLQAYALAVQGAPRKGHVTIVLISLAISVCSMSDGAKISVTLVRGIGMPPTRATDIFARTTRQRSVWHLHLSYWPGAVPTLAPESVGGLSLAWPVAWEDLCQPQEMMEMILTFVTVPWASGKGALFPEFERLWSVLQAEDGREAALKQRYKLDSMREPLANVAIEDLDRGALELNAYFGFAFDASYAFAIAINQLLHAAPEPRGRLLLEELRRTRFTGVSGEVTFDQSGDRLVAHELLNMHADGGAVIAADFSPSSSDFSFQRDLVWMDGSRRCAWEGMSLCVCNVPEDPLQMAQIPGYPELSGAFGGENARGCNALARVARESWDSKIFEDVATAVRVVSPAIACLRQVLARLLQEWLAFAEEHRTSPPLRLMAALALAASRLEALLAKDLAK
ncbi:Grm4, partial [Symbiodinium sp. KB8]